MKKTILVIGSTNLAVFKLRSELILRLKEEGYNVAVAFQSGELGDGPSLSKKYDCDFYEVSIDRRGKNPFNDLLLLKRYIQIIKKVKPYCVLSFNVKCNIYGGIACRIMHIPFLPNVTGLGKGLVEGKITKFITKNLYKIAVRKSKCIFFQNERDKKFFDDNKIKYNQSVVLPGSGVNLNEYKVLDYPKNKKIVFLYIARVMKAKGIDQYLDAAKYFYDNNMEAEFQICGYCEESYQSILEDFNNKGIIKYNGLVNNISDYIENADCVVLPSYHPEGVANVLLETAACGRPIITTKNVGCQETIVDGISGYLIKMKDSDDLIEKMKKIKDLSITERKKMGLSGRKYIESKFDRNIVVNNYLDIIGEI